MLTNYIDQDYDATRKKLRPMLDAGNITFDLLWALFKPGTIAFTHWYKSTEAPYCFRVESVSKESSILRGEYWEIEGRYLDYDGKTFGLGHTAVEIDSFKGVRKITSLSVYPLSCHKDPEGITEELVERGQKFVALQGRHYRTQTGLGVRYMEMPTVCCLTDLFSSSSDSKRPS